MYLRHIYKACVEVMRVDHSTTGVGELGPVDPFESVTKAFPKPGVTFRISH